MRDIDLADWLFDLDKPDERARVAPTALAIATDPTAPKAKAAKARDFAQRWRRCFSLGHERITNAG